MGDASDLFAAHRDRIFRYLSRFIRNRDAAQDLTQDVFLRVSRGPIPATSSTGERAWVFRIAKNLALNYLRALRLRAPLALPEQSTRATQELSSAIRAAIASLPEDERRAFLLREVRGLGYDEIAAMSNVTAVAIRSRVHRARLQLRKALGASPDLDGSGNVRL